MDYVQSKKENGICLVILFVTIQRSLKPDVDGEKIHIYVYDDIFFSF